MSKRKQPAKKKKKPQATYQILSDPWVYLGGLLILTIIIFFPSLFNNFVNWDDQLYVYENYLITDLFERFKEILISPVAGNYHPVTIYSLAIDFSLAGLKPFQYHMTNLVLHLVNIGVVYWLIFQLSNKKWQVALIATLLFAIHPMHVEAVAWVSGRKELLYTLFFCLSVIFYLKYLDQMQLKWLGLSLIIFIFSAASKPSAVVLPIALLLIDYLQNRKLDFKIFIDKIPFLAVSVFFGLLTISAQSAGGAIGEMDKFTILQRLLFGSHSLMIYVFKSVIPYSLNSLYDYPVVANGLPISYYVSPLFLLLVIAGLYYFRKERVLIFGFAFFVLNLLLTLQLVTVGGAIMAERYTYLSYIGLFFVTAWYSAPFLEPKAKTRTIAMVSLGIFTLAYCFVSFQRIKVWKNGETLWTDAIQKNPTDRNYAARGDYYKTMGDLNKALADFNQAVTLRPDKYTHYGDRGTLLFDNQRLDEAVADFQRALEIKPDAEKVLRNMGSALGAKGQYQQAIGYFDQALNIQPDFVEALEDRGGAYILVQNYDAAQQDYSRALELSVHDPSAKVYNGLGVVYYYKDDCQNAVSYYSLALEINAANGQTWFNRSVCRGKLGQNEEALADALKAQQLGFPVDANYINNLQNRN